MGGSLRIFGPDELVEADPTAGAFRERAFEAPGLWAGQVTTQAGAVSGWHHHDSNVSCLYIVRGVMRFECEGLEGYLDAPVGHFVQVPPFIVHRESNPSDETSLALIARAGTGIPTVNVDEAPPPHR
jgi:uncharacterized RmlC-like cupin family protein